MTAPGAVNAFLYGDAADLPNNAIQTFLGSGIASAEFGTTDNSLVSFTVAGNVPVTKGSVYWLVLKPADVNVSDAWNTSNSSGPGNMAASSDDSTWELIDDALPAFRITAKGGAAVPDASSTWTLLALGMAATFGLNLLLHRGLKAGTRRSWKGGRHSKIALLRSAPY